MNLFSGLGAFPLTPIGPAGIDEAAFVGLVRRLVAGSVDMICPLGSTGGYPYLNRAERARVARLAVDAADGVPVVIGIGALATREVLELSADAQAAGASAVLLAPVSYQPLTEDEVFGLYEDVSAELSVPLCVYDNPRTTQFTFSDEFYGRVSRLPRVGSIKIPGVPEGIDAAVPHVQRLRALVPEHVTIGISGDPLAATGLLAGCDAWYSVVGGVLPEQALAITRAAQAGDRRRALALSEALETVWELMRRHGSMRVASALAEELGLVSKRNLPRPLRELDVDARVGLSGWVRAAGLVG
ncbi:dihydrodipicolinate synthase family protein [Occultella gossypii]|uniref:Dihydrodipicolinate synthase family protein n=1 Tax=Occultella gossypii TaxID=2800820 RepID=A0ABS7SGT2_9MICO|nr:dihydrodipicolinate synthase family protein [Occultella gossypii]MBZ2199566.1 dihydrodipicolinate synthase family protein [Occultella gossypii]